MERVSLKEEEDEYDDERVPTRSEREQRKNALRAAEKERKRNRAQEFWARQENEIEEHYQRNRDEGFEEEDTMRNSPMRLRPRENLRPPNYFGDYAMMVMSSPIKEPNSYQEAIHSPEKKEWKNAIKAELNSHEKNGTWEIVQRPEHDKVMSNKWVFKAKQNSTGQIEKFKARLVLRGFEQRYGEHYEDAYSSVTRYESVRLILAIAAAENMPYKIIDFETAFLNSPVDKTIYMEIPEGVDEDPKEYACLLRKGLYGLVQAPALWNKHVTQYLKSLGFVATYSDPSVFVFGSEIIFALFVDDGLLVARSHELIARLIRKIREKFRITESNGQKYIGMELSRDSDGIKIRQTKMIHDLVNQYGLGNSKSASVPMQPGLNLEEAKNGSANNIPFRQIIGSLLFIARVSRPDISYAVIKLSQFTNGHDHTHFNAAKQIVKYLKATSDEYLLLPSTHSEGKVLIGYSDADYAADRKDRKSTSGLAFFYGDSLISWGSNKQKIVALSSCESEYIALCQVAKEAVWLRRLVAELGFRMKNPTKIYVDNTAAIKLAKNQDFHRKSKHFQVRYHYTRELVENEIIEVKYIPTSEQKADIFTKPLYRGKFLEMKELLSIKAGEEQSKEKDFALVCSDVPTQSSGEEAAAEESKENMEKEKRSKQEHEKMKENAKGMCSYLPTGFFLFLMLFGMLGHGMCVDVRNTVPVIWRRSPTKITQGSLHMKLQINLHSPCDFLKQEMFHPDLFDDAVNECKAYYQELFIKPLQEMCPTPSWETHNHHIIGKRALVETLLIIAAVIVGIASGGLITSIYNTVTLISLQFDHQRLKEKVETNTKMIRELQEKFNETIRRLEEHQKDFDSLKATSIKSNFIIGYLTSQLTSGKYIIQEATRMWGKGKLSPGLLNYLNITLPCGEECPVEFAKAKHCGMTEDKKTIFVYVQIPKINTDLILLKPESFKLMKRKDDMTCSQKFHGVNNAILSLSKDCILGTNIEEGNHEMIVFPSDICEPVSDLPTSTQYFHEDVCKPRRSQDEREFIQAKLEGVDVHIYCPEGNVTVSGITQPCGSSVFKLPAKLEFKVNNVPFTVAQEHIEVNATFDPILSVKANFHFKPRTSWNDLYLENKEKTEVNERKSWYYHGIIIFLILLIIIGVSVWAFEKYKARKLTSAQSEMTKDEESKVEYKSSQKKDESDDDD